MTPRLVSCRVCVFLLYLCQRAFQNNYNHSPSFSLTVSSQILLLSKSIHALPINDSSLQSADTRSLSNKVKSDALYTLSNQILLHSCDASIPPAVEPETTEQTRRTSSLQLQRTRRDQNREVCHHCWIDCHRNYGNNLLRKDSDEEDGLGFILSRPGDEIAKREKEGKIELVWYGEG